jgi:hypothetical protein
MTFEALPAIAGANLLGHGHLFKDDRLAFLRCVVRPG